MQKLVRIGFAFLLAWCGFTEALQWFSLLFFHMWIAGDWFLVLLASDAQEMIEFISLNPGPIILAAVILSVGIGVGLFSLWMSRKAWWITAGCFGVYAIVSIAIFERAWSPAYIAYDTLRGLRDYVALVEAGRWTAEDARIAEEASKNADVASLPTVVLVLGESLTTSRMGIYGYAKDTTPNLSAWSTNGLEILPPRRATASYTAKALQDLMVADGMSLVRKLRRKGYHPVLLSAQGHWERYCGVEQMVFSACEQKIYLSDEMHGKSYTDLHLIGWVRDVLEEGPRPLFLIVHLLGSHYPFKERYPDYWDKPEGFDDYDMSVKATDLVLSEILNALPKDGIMVFTSDHGESPNGNSWRDNDDPDMWTVPMLVYPKGSLQRVPEIARSLYE